MVGRIYIIRNLINGKGYVGQTTKSLFVRFNQHKTDSEKGSELALHRALRKHKFENFTIEEVAICDSKLLNDLEKHYVKFYGTYAPTGHGYNLTRGGDGCAEGRVFSKEGLEKLTSVHKGNSYAKGHKVSDEAKVLMSAAHRGVSRPVTEESKVRISNTLKGHPVSEETRAKLSAAQIGKKRGPLSQEAKDKISVANKGRILGPMPEETKSKISKGSKGKKKDSESVAKRTKTRAMNGFTLSSEARSKISKTLSGRQHTEEQKAKQSEGLRKWWENRRAELPNA